METHDGSHISLNIAKFQPEGREDQGAGVRTSKNLFPLRTLCQLNYSAGFICLAREKRQMLQAQNSVLLSSMALSPIRGRNLEILNYNERFCLLDQGQFQVFGGLWAESAQRTPYAHYQAPFLAHPPTHMPPLAYTPFCQLASSLTPAVNSCPHCLHALSLIVLGGGCS